MSTRQLDALPCRFPCLRDTPTWPMHQPLGCSSTWRLDLGSGAALCPAGNRDQRQRRYLSTVLPLTRSIPHQRDVFTAKLGEHSRLEIKYQWNVVWRFLCAKMHRGQMSMRCGAIFAQYGIVLSDTVLESSSSGVGQMIRPPRESHPHLVQQRQTFVIPGL